MTAPTPARRGPVAVVSAKEHAFLPAGPIKAVLASLGLSAQAFRRRGRQAQQVLRGPQQGVAVDPEVDGLAAAASMMYGVAAALLQLGRKIAAGVGAGDGTGQRHLWSRHSGRPWGRRAGSGPVAMISLLPGSMGRSPVRPLCGGNRFRSPGSNYNFLATSESSVSAVILRCSNGPQNLAAPACMPRLRLEHVESLQDVALVLVDERDAPCPMKLTSVLSLSRMLRASGSLLGIGSRAGQYPHFSENQLLLTKL